MRIFIFFLFLPFATLASDIHWQQLTDATFTKAKSENKIVLLNLEANWCHWCHVMHDSTYSNPEVIAYINRYFIPVKADQDAHPELSNRYKEFGWPATIFLNGKGEDIVKRAGYISPTSFLRLLKAIVADPSPEIASENFLNVQPTKTDNLALQKSLQENFINSLDFKVGGFDQSQKYVQWATFEYALFESKDPKVKQWIAKSVDGAKQLTDPEWGGVYQYSTDYDWKHLHFEKLLSIQARYTSIFLLNYFYNQDESSLKFAQKTVDYANRFLLKENGLYSNAQDADLVQGQHAEDYFLLSDAERMKLGIPKVDTNTFTDNNAAMAVALIRMANATGEDTYYKKAQRIYEQLLHRKMKSGLFSHSYEAKEIASLRDQLAMLELLVELAKNNSSDTKIANELQQLVASIVANFENKNGSMKSFSGNNGLAPQPLVEENIRLARMLNWYAAYSKNNQYKELATKMYRFLISEEVSKEYYSEPSLLLLEKELEKEPTQYVYLHTGKGNDFSGALQVMIPFYSIVYDGVLSELPADKQELIGGFEQNVILLCTSNYCSSPIYDEEDLKKQLRR